MKTGTPDTGEVIIAGTPDEWLRLFGYTPGSFREDYRDVPEMLIDQLQLPICRACGKPYEEGPRWCPDCQEAWYRKKAVSDADGKELGE